MLTSLYIHIPFCSHICTYCDFHKEMAKDGKKERYVDALIQEIKYHSNKITDVQTIYIGGGTPSALDLVLLERLLKTIEEEVNLGNVLEYSIETNPNDYTLEFVLLLKKYHVSRVSIGVQTFNRSHLKFLGRTHQNEDVFQAIKLLRANGFDNISIDMMFSLVNQTLEELEKDLEMVGTLDIDHISYYSLILEEKSKLHYLLNKNKISMNSEDLEGLMYNKVINTLTANNYVQYEISNFKKTSKESIHNMTYWLNKEYLGLGTGSHSLVEGSRYFNPTNITKYIQMIKKNDFDFSTAYEYNALQEEMMLGLRLISGVNINDIEEKYQIKLLERFPELRKYLKEEIIEINNGYLRFTTEGILLGNLVFQIFVEVL